MKVYSTCCVLLIANLLLAQKRNTTFYVKQLVGEYHCPKIALFDIISKDTIFHWDNLEKDNLFYEVEEFNVVKQRFQSKTMYSDALSDYVCVHKASIGAYLTKEKLWRVIVIYEIGFKYLFQARRVMNSVKKYKVRTLDWPDASIPVRFYQNDTSVFIFLDYSDDYYFEKKEEILYFENAANKIMSYAHNTPAKGGP